MGSIEEPVSYSVPCEANKVFLQGIIENPKISDKLPIEVSKYASRVRFEGSNLPSIPINWRMAESMSALKALEGAVLSTLLERKYNAQPEKLIINTDHAQLYIFSAVLWTIDPDGEPIPALPLGPMSKENAARHAKMFPNFDKHKAHGSYHRSSCTNIYKTKDGRFFNLHGSMNPDATLDSIGLPHNIDVKTVEKSWKPYMEKLAQIDSAEMQHLATDVYGQAGTICWTTDEYKLSEHGRANDHVGLFEIHEHKKSSQLPCWWPDSPKTSSKRPLAGLKVVDLTRVIAAPAVTRGLAEMGASVMRVTAPHITDYSSLHCDLNWGKWNCYLDLRLEDDREKLRLLILDADVVVQGYRPHVLDKWGFGREDILNICKDRERGIIYVRENCYGWYGPWAGRSGWQQISDACCGVSMELGRAMGFDEPVIPFFPNSDYSTGVSGVVGVLLAILQRAEKGGSYTVDLALNYYSQWLVSTVGVYPPPIWNYVWDKSGRNVYRHHHNVQFTLPKCVSTLRKTCSDILFRDEFFEERRCENIKTSIRAVRPIIRFPDNEVRFGFDIGTRTNGIDVARWPRDLDVEVVTLDS